MTYSTILDDGQPVYFTIYNYHYQNPELKNQFEGTYTNIVVLFQKTGATYTHLDTILLDNPRDFFVYKLPVNTLYNTDKVLLLGGHRPADRQETIEYLKKLTTPIKKHFEQPIPCEQLE